MCDCRGYVPGDLNGENGAWLGNTHPVTAVCMRSFCTATTDRKILLISKLQTQLLNKPHMLVTCSEVQEYSGGDGRATGEPQGWDHCLEKR